MPHMQKTAIGIFVSDIHLSENASLARRREVSWYNAMSRPLNELSKLQKQLNCRVFICGDIFHKWKVSPELINFAIDYLPDKAIAIPGQHDLPYHRYDLMHKSGYGVLEKTGKINNVGNGHVAFRSHHEKRRMSVQVDGYPWNSELRTVRPSEDHDIQVAIVHGYCWSEGHSFPGCPEEEHASNYQELLKGYDVCFFGDNHKPFDYPENVENNLPEIVNIGSFLRRNSDEIDHTPRAVIMYSDGSLENHYFDTSKDVFLSQGEVIESVEREQTDFEEVMDVLKNVMSKEGRLTLNTVVKQVLDQTESSDYTRRIIRELLEDA